MKCNWRRWLWGLIPLVMLSWVAVQAERMRIEQELTEAATAALAQSGASWARVAFQGRDAVLSGKAWDEDDTDSAQLLLRKLSGVRVVDNKADLIEKADTYVWIATRRNHRIRLSGFAPNIATRQAILGVTKANFPGYEVIDRMTLMRGVPSADTWLGGVSFALTQLAAMRRGEVRLDDLGLSITGEAQDLAAFRTIKSALLNNPPKGIKISLDQLNPPQISPYVWAVQSADGKLDLSGHFPNEAARTEVLAAARATARAGVVDNMQPGEGAPPDWKRAALAAVHALAALESGRAELKDAALLVSGVAADEAAAEKARGLLRNGLTPQIKLTEQIRPREPKPSPDPKADAPSAQKGAEPAAQPDIKAPEAKPPETRVELAARACQATLVELTNAGQILFERASAELDGTSSATLAKVAEAVKACPDVMVRIEGHTDLEGTPESNQSLALRRAQSVLDFMVRAGVDARQLEPAGYGETRPVAPNDTSENRAKNRRIEFAVRPR